MGRLPQSKRRFQPEGVNMGFNKEMKKAIKELNKMLSQSEVQIPPWGQIDYSDSWAEPEDDCADVAELENRWNEDILLNAVVEESPVQVVPKPPSAKASMAKHVSYCFDVLTKYSVYEFLVVSLGENKEIYQYFPHISYAKKIADDDVGIILEATLDNLGLPEEQEKLSTALQRELVAKIKRQPALQRTLDEFYQHKRKTNCATGVIDISRSGEISMEARTEDIIFDFFVDANYLPNASLEDAQAFAKYCAISLEGNPQKIQLLLEMIGYTLFSSMEGKCFLICIGVPNSGKSLILNFVKKLLGADLATTVSLHELGDKFDKAEIFGKRINVVSEVSKKKLKGEDVLKAMASGDSIGAEFKGKKPFSFPVYCKLWFAANEFPSLEDVDTTGAFYNRMVVLCYRHSVTKAEKDPELEQKLWAEKDIIFSLAIKAYAELVQRGYEFTQPEDSMEFMANYRANENSFQRFLDEDVIFDPNGIERKVDVVKKYKIFCQRNGLATISDSDINRMLEAMCKAGKIRSEKIKSVHSKGRPADGYSGLRLFTTEDEYRRF